MKKYLLVLSTFFIHIEISRADTQSDCLVNPASLNSKPALQGLLLEVCPDNFKLKNDEQTKAAHEYHTLWSKIQKGVGSEKLINWGEAGFLDKFSAMIEAWQEFNQNDANPVASFSPQSTLSRALSESLKKFNASKDNKLPTAMIKFSMDLAQRDVDGENFSSDIHSSMEEFFKSSPVAFTQLMIDFTRASNVQCAAQAPKQGAVAPQPTNYIEQIAPMLLREDRSIVSPNLKLPLDRAIALLRETQEKEKDPCMKNLLAKGFNSFMEVYPGKNSESGDHS